MLISDLEGVEQKVTKETNEAKHGAFRDRLINDKGEEDGVNPKQRDESQGGLCQSGQEEKNRNSEEFLNIVRNQKSSTIVTTMSEQDAIACRVFILTLKLYDL